MKQLSHSCGRISNRKLPLSITMLPLFWLVLLVVPSLAASWTDMTISNVIDARNDVPPRWLNPRHHANGIYDPPRDRIVFFGGDSQMVPVYPTDVWEYRFSGTEWEEVSTSATVPPGRSGHSLLYISPSSVFVVGGKGTDSTGTVVQVLSDAWRLSLTSHSWTQRADIPIARERHGAVVSNGDFYVWGGRSATFLSDAWHFDVSSNSWNLIALSGDIPSARMDHGMVEDGSHHIYIYGGIHADQIPLGDLFLWDVDTSVMSCLSPFDWQGWGTGGRCEFSMLWWSGGFLVLAGRGTALERGANMVRNDAWKFTISNSSWSELVSDTSIMAVAYGTAPPGRVGFVSILKNDEVWIVGGNPFLGGNDEGLDDMWKLAL